MKALLFLVVSGATAFAPQALHNSRFATTNLYSTLNYLDGLNPSPGVNGGTGQDYRPTAYERRTTGGTFVNETLRLRDSDFPIKPEELISLAKQAIKAGLGVDDESVLSEDFEFCAPFVGPLGKEEYLGALKSFKLLEAFPDLDNRFYNFHVDPFEFNRVWYMVRPVATHTGRLFGKSPSGKHLELPPQAQSLTFDEDGLVIDMTIGYVMDRRVGNTGGLGGAFGLFYGAGQPLPFRECHPYRKSFRFRLVSWIGRLGKMLLNK